MTATRGWTLPRSGGRPVQLCCWCDEPATRNLHDAFEQACEEHYAHWFARAEDGWGEGGSAALLLLVSAPGLLLALGFVVKLAAVASVALS